MKICVLFLFIFCGSSLADSGFTEQDLSDFIALQIYRYFDRVAQQMVDAGLDPLVIEKAEYKNAFIPSVVEVDASINNLNVSGLSKFSIDSAYYIQSLRRLAVDFSQSWTSPLNINIGNAEAELKVSNNTLKVEISGNVIVQNFVLATLVDFNFDNGTSVTDVVTNFVPGSIKPSLSVRVSGNDYSEAVNNFLENTLVDFIDDNNSQIDGILASIAKFVLNALLKRQFLI